MSLAWGRVACAALLCAAVAAVARPAAAADLSWLAQGHFYLGAGVGRMESRAKFSRFSRPPITCPQAGRPLPCVEELDDSSVSVSAFGGYQVNPYAALEAGYANLPETFDARSTDPNFPPPALTDVHQDSEVYFLRGVFTLPLTRVSSWSPLEKFSASAVVGFSHWRTDSRVTFDARTPTAGPFGFLTVAERSNSGNSLTFGARLNYDASEQWRITAGWDRYQDLGKEASAVDGFVSNPTLAPFVSEPGRTVKVDVDVFSLNVVYRFR